MNAKPSPNHRLNRVLMSILSLFAILVILLPVIQIGFAVSSSPFLGQWQVFDIDGNEMRLSINRPADGPFQITWTGSHISSCGSAPGLIRGTGQLNKGDPHRLEADLYLECLISGASSAFHFLWRYHPVTNTLSGRSDDGVVTTWRRPEQPLTPTTALNLRVNYGDNWVESFYEAGHAAWITVTESDGVTVKATAELMTESKEFWAGASGFQTIDSDWFDAHGHQMKGPPDIRPDDWVFGWMDNGASAQVQIGDIRGAVDLTTDSVEGTILAPWLTNPVPVGCLDWGSGRDPFAAVDKDGGLISANGTQTYSCSWAGEWDIQSGQSVGVGYIGSDGNWVANSFFIADPAFTAYLPGAIEGYDWPMGNTITINVNGKYTAQAVSEQRPAAPPGRTRVLFELNKNNFFLKPGDHLVMTDGSTTKDTVVTALAVTDFDVNTRTVSGTYDPDSNLRVWLYDREGKITSTDPEIGIWVASFDQLQSGSLGGASQQDVDGDGTSIEFEVPQTFFVNSTADAIDDDGLCTLREAIIAANTNAPSGDMSGECPRGLDSQTDIILLRAGTVYSLTIDRTSNDTAADGDLDIVDNPSTLDLIIRVDGDGKATISQDAALVDDRVLENHEATVKIENLTLTGGSNVGGGGGLLNNGTLDMAGSVVSGNSVSWDGGGIYNGNVARMSIDSSMIAGNTSAAFAGGIMNKGTLTLKQCEVRRNTSVHGGGGINNEGSLIIDASTLSANTSSQGGALYNSGTAVIGNTLVGGPLADDANTAEGGGGLFSLGTLTVSDSAITGNRASYGGGLFNWTGGTLTISSSTISNNHANEGGGLHNKEHSTALIHNGTVFSGNYAEWGGGGIDNWGTITITESTLRENMSAGEAGDALTSGVFEDSSATISGSCIVGNGDTAIFSNQLPFINAVGNWWGSRSGPAHRSNPGGLGDSVSDFVDFLVWLTEPASICAP